MKKLYNRVVVTSGLVLGGVGVSLAQEGPVAPDFEGITGPAVDTVASLQPALMAVGGVIIGLAAVALGIRWVKATFF